MTDLAHRVATVVGRHLTPPRDGQHVPADLPLAQLGLDSLASIDLVLDLEDTLGIAFPDDLLTPTTFRTVASIRAVVGRLPRPTATDP